MSDEREQNMDRARLRVRWQRRLSRLTVFGCVAMLVAVLMRALMRGDPAIGLMRLFFGGSALFVMLGVSIAVAVMSTWSLAIAFEPFLLRHSWVETISGYIVDAQNARRVRRAAGLGHALMVRPDEVWLGENVSMPDVAVFAGAAIIDSNVTLSGDSHFGDGVRIGRHTTIAGFCELATGVTIGESVQLEDVRIGPGVRVGAKAVIRRASVEEYAYVAPETVLEDRHVKRGVLMSSHR